MNLLYTKKEEKNIKEKNINIYNKNNKNILQINSLIFILEFDYDFYPYNISFNSIKYTITNKYSNLLNLENLNMKYLAACIFIKYTSEFNEDYFTSNNWKKVFNILNNSKILEDNAKKQILIYMDYINNEEMYENN